MQIWVDADAVPIVAKDLIIKTAERTQTMAIFVNWNVMMGLKELEQTQ